MLEIRQERLAKRMRWAARIIGLVAAGFLLAMMIGAAIAEVLTEGWETITTDIEGILIGVLGAIALAGCIISWWRERLAGILLVLTAVGLGIHISICAGHNHFLAWLMVGFPYLVAGVLFLTSWRLSRKTS
jgi:mannose/fructose/N-acetylgalactosamine-specific phosphotransferase system component IID